MSRKNGDAINNDFYLFSLQYTFRVVRDCGLPFKKVKHLETDAFLEHSFCSEIEKYFLDKVFHNFFNCFYKYIHILLRPKKAQLIIKKVLLSFKH